ncbi:uroporphyrinogen-III C-methyltransferase [soil metagenome]
MFALDLRGRLVVAVGGGAVGTKRAGDLLGRGARVRVISPVLSELLRTHAAAGRIEWWPRVYAGPADLAEAWLVHAATGSAQRDGDIAADAHDQQIWCVNSSNADHGSARTPARASVDTPDGTIEVGVSTGRDPRRAVVVRDSVLATLRSGAVDVRRRRTTDRGWVALVGGGPGRDDLLTVRGAQLIAAADVVVVDRLAPRGLLATLPAEVTVIDVGKEVGAHAVPQSRINEILIEHGRAGRNVVRLKGGDPYVLGRGSEERLACERAGLSVEVVPGVTSAVAVPAAAGIPLTHRGVARGFSVVTGHDEIPDVPAQSSHTVVLLMGVARLGDSTAAMRHAGRPSQCPAAIIERGYLPGQRTTYGTLGNIAERARSADVRSPAVVVVGDVVRLSPGWPGGPGAQAQQSGLAQPSGQARQPGQGRQAQRSLSAPALPPVQSHAARPR